MLYNILLYWVKHCLSMGADIVWQVVFMPGQHPTSEGAVTQRRLYAV